jgi:hypothetical protein
MDVKISNKVRLAFDRPKAKQFQVMDKSSSTIAHWLHNTTLQGLMQNRGSIKCFGRNEASLKTRGSCKIAGSVKCSERNEASLKTRRSCKIAKA